MHIRRILLSVPLLLLALSCSRLAPVGVEDGRQTVISARILSTDLQSRTWIDSKESGQVLPLYWSDGDRVNVNGQVSSPISVAAGEKKSQADFSLRSVEAPFKVVYPSSILSEDASYNESGDITVNLPATQAYCDSSFASSTAILCGYSASEETPVALRNMSAAVRVKLLNATEDPLAICEAKIISRNGGICGNFVLNPQNGTLLPAEDAGVTVALDITSVTIGSEGTWFWFALPAGTYPDGFDIFFTRESDRRVMQCEWTSTTALSAGIIYTFQNVTFVPGAKDIETAEEWNEFADAYNAGGDISKYLYKDGVIRVGKDISTTELHQVINFTGYFDGQGHTITRSAASTALFSSVGGDVRNLHLSGKWSCSGEESASSVADSLLAGGCIYGCTNEMTINLSGDLARYYVGGIVRILCGGTVENCTNNAVLMTQPDCGQQDVEMILGGIAAQVETSATGVRIIGCSNSDSLIVNSCGTYDTYGIRNNAVGGIVGMMANTSLAIIENCTNTGSIEYKSDNITNNTRAIKAYATGVGGIVGIAAPLKSYNVFVPADGEGVLVEIRSCRNNATIHNCAVNYSMSKEGDNKVYTGGIAGAFVGFNSNRSSITDSKNTGNIMPYDIVGKSQRSGFSAVASGFIGIGGNVDLIRDTVDCSIGNGKRPTVSMGGMLGYTIKPFKLSSSKVHYDGYWTRLSYYKMDRAAVAVVPVKSGTTTNMNLEPDIKGSVIENSIIGARPYSSTSTMSSYSDVTDQSSNLKTQLNFNTDDNAVTGQGYTTLADDVTFTNVIYNF